ncbi:MAG: CdaR family protein [Aggregatilineales bacterium]
MQQQRTRLRFFLDNLGWLTGSLLLAFAVWYTALSARDPVEQRRLIGQVPIELRYDEGLIVANRPPVAAQVTVRGLQSAFETLELRQVKVIADLSGLPPREEPYTIELRGSLAPEVRGAAVIGVQPSRISVQLARRVEQLKDISVRFEQEPPIGYTVTAQPAQSEVLVVGAAERVAQVAAVQVKVNVQSQRGTFTVTLPLSAVDADGRPITDVTLTPAEVAVTVEVQQRSDVVELAVEPRLTGDLPSGYLRVNQMWSPRRVFVRGNRRTIEAMNGVIFTEPIDLSNRTHTFTQIVRLSVPSGVILLELSDITVTVEIEPVQGSREFVGIPVQVQGIDTADFAVTLQPERVNVIVRGAQVALEALTADDIRVFVSLSGLGVGVHQVTLQANVAREGFSSENVVIPINAVEVSITARNPTPTPAP